MRPPTYVSYNIHKNLMNMKEAIIDHANRKTGAAGIGRLERVKKRILQENELVD